MRRVFSLLAGAAGAVLVLQAAGAQAPAQTPPSPAPRFGQEVQLVSVDAIVLDERGEPVTGLAQGDFTLQEEGVVQQIVSFEAVRFEESEPTAAADSVVSSNLGEAAAAPSRSFTVIFDDVHLTPPGAERARRELRKAFDSFLPGDQVTLVPTSGAPWWSARFPEGRADAEAFLAALKGHKVLDLSAGRISDWEAMQIHNSRNAQVLGVVMRRWYENGLIAEVPARDPGVMRDLEINPGVPLVRAKANEQYQLSGRRAGLALGVIERVVDSLAAQRGRKAVFLVSEGFVQDPTRTEFRELVRAARAANATLYYFDAKGQLGANAPGNEAEVGRPIEERDRLVLDQHFARDSEGSESVALDTGGRVTKGTEDLAGAMRKVLRESRSYYLLGYVPSNTRRDGKFRSLKVSVARPGLEVRARKGYYAPSGNEKRARAAAGALDPAVRTALDSPLPAAGIPLRMASLILGGGEGGQSTVLLVADLDLRPVTFRAEGDRMEASLDTYVVVTPRDGGENRRVEKHLDLSLPPAVREQVTRDGLPFLRDFELPPGVYQARLLVRDAGSQAVGTVRHTFTVPPAQGLRTSTPVLTDVVQPQAAGELPMPIARRRFAKGARLNYAFDVYGAARNPQGRSEVLVGYVVRREGRPFVQSPPAPLTPAPDGSLSHRLVLSLAQAEPGRYEIVLTVADQVAGTVIERRDAFLVGPS